MTSLDKAFFAAIALVLIKIICKVLEIYGYGG